MLPESDDRRVLQQIKALGDRLTEMANSQVQPSLEELRDIVRRLHAVAGSDQLSGAERDGVEEDAAKFSDIVSRRELGTVAARFTEWIHDSSQLCDEVARYLFEDRDEAAAFKLEFLIASNRLGAMVLPLLQTHEALNTEAPSE